MKIKAALFLVAIAFLTGCSAKEASRPAVSATKSISDILNEKMQEEQAVEEVPEEEPQLVGNVELPAYDAVDIDLLTLTADLRYAQVYDMCVNPDAYVGKVVKAQGLYSYWKNEETGAEYKTVIITDALACCAQGIEFKEVAGQRLPIPYTGQEDASGCELTATGVFGYYVEDGNVYIELSDAVIE